MTIGHFLFSVERRFALGPISHKRKLHGQHSNRNPQSLEETRWKQIAGVLFIYLLLALSAYSWVFWFLEWEGAWSGSDLDEEQDPLGTIALILLFGFAYAIWFLAKASLQKREARENWLVRSLFIAALLFILFPFLYLAWRLID